MTKRSKPTVAVALDGLLAEDHGWQGLDRIGPPVEGAKEFVDELGRVARVVLYTTRTNIDPELGRVGESIESLKSRIEVWLDRHEIDITDIWTGQGKPLATAYVGPRNVGVTANPSQAQLDAAYLAVLSLIDEAERCAA